MRRDRSLSGIATGPLKDLWIGGPVPLGYQVVERKRVPLPEEAERVRTIMRRYLEARNVPRLIETRKDLARPGDPPAIRYQQGMFDRAVTTGLADVLEDEHALRCLANLDDASELRDMFHRAQILEARLMLTGDTEAALRSLITAITVRKDHLEVVSDPASFGQSDQAG